MRRASPPTISSRSASMSCNATSATSSWDRCDTSSGVYVEPAPITASFIPSPLPPGERDAFDESLLRQEEEDDHRRHHEERRSHREVPLHLVQRAELGEPDLEHPVVRILPCVEKRQEEVVERVEKREERDRGNRGLGQTNDDGAENAQLSQAIDARGVEVLLGNRHEELA